MDSHVARLLRFIIFVHSSFSGTDFQVYQLTENTVAQMLFDGIWGPKEHSQTLRLSGYDSPFRNWHPICLCVCSSHRALHCVYPTFRASFKIREIGGGFGPGLKSRKTA